MKVKCYSVRLKGLESISDKAYLATAFDGASGIIPKSCVFGSNDRVVKSNSFWVAAWILEKKNLQYSKKVSAWFDNETGNMLPDYKVSIYIPEKRKPVSDNTISGLER